MSQTKSGGNKKASSPSTLNYWKRAVAGKFSETHRAKRIARHAKRQGLTAAQIARSTAVPTFPRVPIPRPVERAIFAGSSVPPKSRPYRTRFFLTFVKGHLVDISPIPPSPSSSETVEVLSPGSSRRTAYRP